MTASRRVILFALEHTFHVSGYLNVASCGESPKTQYQLVVSRLILIDRGHAVVERKKVWLDIVSERNTMYMTRGQGLTFLAFPPTLPSAVESGCTPARWVVVVKDYPRTMVC